MNGRACLSVLYVAHKDIVIDCSHSGCLYGCNGRTRLFILAGSMRHFVLFLTFLMLAVLEDCLVEKVLDVFLDLLLLFLGDVGRVVNTIVLVIGCNKRLADILGMSLQYLFRQLVAELVHHIFDVREKLQGMSAD